MLEAKDIISQTSVTMGKWLAGITIHKCNLLDPLCQKEVLSEMGIELDLAAPSSPKSDKGKGAVVEEQVS